MTTPTFTEALQVEVAQLQAEHPLLKAALDRAFTLLVNGDLFPLEDGHTAHVRSQSEPDVSYVVNGSCDCLSAQYRKEPCVHRYAFRLYQKAVERLTVDPADERWEPVEVSEEASPAPPPAPPAVLPEAMFSVTLKGRLDGCEDAMLTVRAWSLAEFQANLAVVRGLIVTPASPPADTQGPGQLSPQQHNAAAMHRPVSGFCPVHNVPMHRNTGKDGRTWYSHRLPKGGFCKGK